VSRPLPFPITAGSLVRRNEALEFLRLLWAIDHGLQRRSKRMERVIGVTGVQRLVIRVLAQFPAITPGQLAGVLHLHPSTITGVVQRLQRRGFVLRRIDPRDKRRWRLALTPRGRGIHSRRGGTLEGELERVLTRLPPPELAAAWRVLEALGDQLAC